MKRFARWVLVFGLCVVASHAVVEGNQASAEEPPINRVVVFGDSLSDTGNLYRSTIADFPFEGPTPLFPIAFYPGGRFSNGPVWVEHFAEQLDLEIPTPVVGPFPGTNFAFGGAETGFGLSQRLSPNIGEQINLYASTVQLFLGDELIVLWGGSNDFNPIPPATFPAPADVVANTVQHIETLHALGGRQFLVPNLTPIGSTPQFKQIGTDVELLVNLLSLQHNLLLEVELGRLERELGITIHRFNTFGIVGAVAADPTELGFGNATEPAFDLATLSVVPNPDEYVYWDTIHPTTRAHRMLGQLAAATLHISRTRRALEDTSSNGIRIRGAFAGFVRLDLILQLLIADFHIQQADLDKAVDRIETFERRIIWLQIIRKIGAQDAADLLDAAEEIQLAIENAGG